MKFLILILITFFLSSNILLAKEKCSDYKKLSKTYLKCISGKLKDKTSNISNISDTFFWFPLAIVRTEEEFKII